MKVFLDTEFTGLHIKTTLISVGLVANDGRTFYAELNDYDESQITPWIKENVIAKLKYTAPKIAFKRDGSKEHPDAEDEYYTLSRHLPTAPIPSNAAEKGCTICMRGDTKMVGDELRAWFAQFEEVEIWSDVLAYDWVLFVNLFGTAFDLPKNVYYIPFDLATLMKDKQIDPDINREDFALVDKNHPDKHNALFDARVQRMVYHKLMGTHCTDDVLYDPKPEVTLT